MSRVTSWLTVNPICNTSASEHEPLATKRDSGPVGIRDFLLRASAVALGRADDLRVRGAKRATRLQVTSSEFQTRPAGGAVQPRSNPSIG
jgi:hypothetical protein